MSFIDPKRKRFLYVAACGRSGTTILGYLLGNARGALDLGEVNEWLRFEGRPNGFGPGTENYAFWDQVMTRIIENHGPLDFNALRLLQRRVDYHYPMFGQLFTGHRFRQQEYERFRVFLGSLYQAIFDVSDANILIDSSKYPSRLWHLSKIIPAENLYIVHLKRKASDVIQAMRTSNQGKPRSVPAAAAYYYGVEFLISQVCKSLPPSKVIDIQYEHLLAAPEECLDTIGNRFDIDFGGVIYKVANRLPLRRGFVFNGNRMRMQEEVVFRKKGRAA